VSRSGDVAVGRRPTTSSTCRGLQPAACSVQPAGDGTRRNVGVGEQAGVGGLVASAKQLIGGLRDCQGDGDFPT
jgi:hypothetical protein